MTKIMFICLGNICRSPMAEFVFKDILEKNRDTERFYVSSAATSDENVFNGIGAPVYPQAKEILIKHGIDCGGKRAVQVKKSDYDKYDFFICMDSQNVRNTLRIFGGDRENKIRKLLEFADSGRDVSDPWYTRDFDTAYNDIVTGCRGLYKKLTEGKQ